MRRSRISRWWWVISGAGGLVLVVSVIAWLGGERAPDGDPWLANPDAIILALIGTVTTIGAPLIGSLQKIRAGVESTQEQVSNDHEENLRVELDRRHEETKEWFRALARDIGGIREELRGLRSDDRRLESRIWDLEKTEPTDGRRRRDQS